jgi:hypothetical protein
MCAFYFCTWPNRSLPNNEKIAQGWFAADISDKRNILIDRFDPNADILLLPRVQGGI